MGMLTGPLVTFQFVMKQSVFYVGDPVVGTLVLDVESDTKARTLRISIIGTEYCHWEEERNTATDDIKDREPLIFTNTIEIFRQDNIVWGSQQAGQVLTKGQYEFPFTFDALLDGFPPSFEDTNGYVRYTLEAHLGVPWGKPGVAEIPISVAPSFHFLSVQSQGKKRAAQAQKTPGCLFSKNGLIESTISLTPESSLVNFPGIYCGVKVEIQNKSQRKVKSARLELRELTRFVASNDARNDNWRTVSVTNVPCAPLKPGTTGQSIIDCSNLFENPLFTVNGRVCHREYTLRLVVMISCASACIPEFSIYCVAESPPDVPLRSSEGEGGVGVDNKNNSDGSNNNDDNRNSLDKLNQTGVVLQNNSSGQTSMVVSGHKNKNGSGLLKKYFLERPI
eukprot:c15321_g1_i1.p1 GENE.c15321_g1_i1~~c15321_g1_i1.p1  ORF type:complete len:393 (-),score=167.32 c15321_g1_i1:34-1212(-)